MATWHRDANYETHTRNPAPLLPAGEHRVRDLLELSDDEQLIGTAFHEGAGAGGRCGAVNQDVAWGGEWRHEACGASGDAVWEDEDTAYSRHECDQDGEVTWSAEWECHNCGASGLTQFPDGSTAYADHDECDDEDVRERKEVSGATADAGEGPE